MQKTLAREVLDNPNEQSIQMGSFYVGHERDKEELCAKFETLKSLGLHMIEWYDNDTLKSMPVIDSSSYATGPLRVVQEEGNALLSVNTKVNQVNEPLAATLSMHPILEFITVATTI
eukprot:10628350-Ditylum_brightwellii.AAC.1